MSMLRLEELESRQLLSAAHYAPQQSFRQPMPNNPPMWVVESPRGGDFGSPGGQDFGSGTSGPGYGPSPQSLDYFVVPLDRVIVITFEQSDHSTPDPDGGSYANGAVNIPASTPKAAPTGTVTDITTVHPAVATAPTRVSPQTPFTIFPTGNVPALSTEILGPTAVNVALNANRPGAVIGTTGPALLPLNPAVGAETTIVDDGQPVEPKPAEAALPGVLAALPTMDLTALGQGLRQFLSRIEQAGEVLVGDGDGLRPWLIAGAAAATACEIARRQIQRTDDGEQRTGRKLGIAAGF